MIVVLTSAKGSPGVTSTALVLAAVWPRPVVLVEADPAGGDLAYRCVAAGGGSVPPGLGLLSLAAAARSGHVSATTLEQHAVMLGCGVRLVQGVVRGSQAAGLTSLWPMVAAAIGACGVDVIVDAGRVNHADRGGLLGTLRAPAGATPDAVRADVVAPVGVATLESVMHLTQNGRDLAGPSPDPSSHAARTDRVRPRPDPAQGVVRRAGEAGRADPVVSPVLVTADGSAQRNCEDLDHLMLQAGVTHHPTQPIPIDARALARLEGGEDPRGRLGRTLLLRAAGRIAVEWGALASPPELTTDVVLSPQSPEAAASTAGHRGGGSAAPTLPPAAAEGSDPAAAAATAATAVTAAAAATGYAAAPQGLSRWMISAQEQT